MSAVFPHYLFALVGGSWEDSRIAGMWFWNFNNASSNYGTGTGARLIIFKIHIKGFGVFGTGVSPLHTLCSCRR